MNRFIFIVFSFILTFNSFASVVIFGTRFFINDEIKKLKVNLKNNDDTAYLIKTNVYCDNSDKYFVVPPLFVLPNNKENSITIINDTLVKDGLDHVCSLVISTIPKSTSNTNNVTIAVRSNLKLIYRHDKLKNIDLSQVKLIKKSDNNVYLFNDSNFALTLEINLTNDDNFIIKKTIAPKNLLPLPICKAPKCSVSVSVINDDNSILETLKLTTL